MYAILTKNSNDTWDGIYQIYTNGPSSTVVVDAALETGLPIIGMNASEHKTSAVRGATWDGTSFTGGTVNPETPLDDEALAKINRYVFLCDNKVVFSLTMSVNSSTAEMFDAAFSGETILVKHTLGPINVVGKTFNWDGTDLTQDIDS
jgi:hypothetical protein